MHRADVFRGTGDTTRLENLLLEGPPEAGPRDSAACVGELLSSAVEDLAGDVADLTHRLEAVEARSGSESGHASAETERCDYLVYCGTPGGYQLSEQKGMLPTAGSAIAELGATVLRIGRSPLPGDPRACVFVM
jgi:hypothetical protein